MIDMDAKLAVLICLYGGDRKQWFQQAVDSIVAQTVGFDRIRIYLGVDGPVGQDIEDYLVRHQALFYKVCRNPQNEGLTKTLNQLIKKLGNEDYIFRLDADDFCAPGRFEKQVNFLSQNPEIEVLGSGIIEIDSTGKSIFQRSYPLDIDAIKKRIHRGNPLAHSSVCFRRSFFDKIKGYPEDVTYNQDLALWFEGLKIGVRFANLSEPLVFMRVNSCFYRRRARKRATDELKIYFRGIYALHGLSFKYSFPLARLLFRLLPVCFIRFLYSNPLRSKLTA